MEHSIAINKHAAERYLLGELSETERDAYEEHFFCCSRCAEEIKSASEFMENARQVIQNEIRAEQYGRAARRSSWKDWLNFKIVPQPLLAAACLMFLAFIGYQNSVTIPEMTGVAAVQVSAVPPPLHASRSAVHLVNVSRRELVILPFEIASADGNTSYQVSLAKSNGETVPVRIVPAEEARRPLELHFAAGSLQPGKYDIVAQALNGRSKGEPDHFPFELKFKD